MILRFSTSPFIRCDKPVKTSSLETSGTEICFAMDSSFLLPSVLQSGKPSFIVLCRRTGQLNLVIKMHLLSA